jgi:hypothetical protein
LAKSTLESACFLLIEPRLYPNNQHKRSGKFGANNDASFIKQNPAKSIVFFFFCSPRHAIFVGPNGQSNEEAIECKKDDFLLVVQTENVRKKKSKLLIYLND